ncbi:MAG: DNA mismatch repair endonuclease MutL, partial [Candidatus Omnitrophica bacterium]|nr:DNA mismatch repair endonuclease MutL [Candidatus Omnitrophota bacterium]
FSLITRTADSSAGTRIEAEGGILAKVKECPCAPGTTIEVRDLFFNTPARRKFLKQDTTEMGHILDCVTSLALARRNVRFLLDSGDKRPLDLLPTADLSTRARAIFGDAWADQTLTVEKEVPHMRLSGLVGKPSLASGNRAQQFFFVNQRWVKAYGLSHGLQAGYHGFLMQHQFPMAILFLDLDPQYVDVNVHPTKQQVRLSHETLIKSLIEHTVQAALKEHGDLAPSVRISGGTSAGPGDLPQTEVRTFDFGTRPTGREIPGQVADLGTGAFAWNVDPGLSSIHIGEGPVITRVLGQVHRTYILAETEEGYALIDQHAAHERVMFEELLKNFEAERPASQRLLLEEVLELHPRQKGLLTRHLSFLNKIGFEIENFGETSFVIRALPAALCDEDPLSLVRLFVDEKEAGKVRTRLSETHENVAAMIACKRRSVKASDALTFQEMQGLLARLARCENPFNCPHGRPCLIKYSLEEIEKQFKRK